MSLFDFTPSTEHRANSTASAGTADRTITESFDDSRNTFAIKTATGKDSNVKFLKAMRRRKQTIVPEGPDYGSRSLIRKAAIFSRSSIAQRGPKKSYHGDCGHSRQPYQHSLANRESPRKASGLFRRAHGSVHVSHCNGCAEANSDMQLCAIEDMRILIYLRCNKSIRWAPSYPSTNNSYTF
jgi:hypothetical protein